MNGGLLKRTSGGGGGGGTDASSVTYTPAGTGAVKTNVKAKQDQRPSVADYMTAAQYADGQTGAPALNVASVFGQAAISAPAHVNQLGNGTGITFAKVTEIYVPPGRWTLGGRVDTGGIRVMWVFAAGATLTDENNLNGALVREGQKVHSIAVGNYDAGCGYSVILNYGNYDQGAQVSGWTTPSQFGTYASRDTVGLYVANGDNVTYLPVASSATVAYNPTNLLLSGASILTADQVKLLRVGMAIDTLHATKYSGLITSWAADGTSITVSNWYLSPGTGIAATPINGIGCRINPTTNIWGQNTVVSLGSTSVCNGMTGYEMDMLNDSPTATVWGYECIPYGSYKIEAGFQTRSAGGANNFCTYGFSSKANDVVGFFYSGTKTGFQNNNTKWISGIGSPESVVTAGVGSLYTRSDGGAGTTLYVKESGAGNTGWIAK